MRCPPWAADRYSVRRRVHYPPGGCKPVLHSCGSRSTLARIYRSDSPHEPRARRRIWQRASRAACENPMMNSRDEIELIRCASAVPESRQDLLLEQINAVIWDNWTTTRPV